MEPVHHSADLDRITAEVSRPLEDDPVTNNPILQVIDRHRPAERTPSTGQPINAKASLVQLVQAAATLDCWWVTGPATEGRLQAVVVRRPADGLTEVWARPGAEAALAAIATAMAATLTIGAGRGPGAPTAEPQPEGPSTPAVPPAAKPATPAALANEAVRVVATVRGPAAAASAFAGRWADAHGLVVSTDMLQRLHALRHPDDLRHPDQPSGALRPAAADDLPTVLDWSLAFQHEAFGPPGPGKEVNTTALTAAVEHLVHTGCLYVWADGDRLRAMVGASAPTAGVSRIHLVYTPPEERRSGLAAAATAAACAHVFDNGTKHCALFADLANPLSNRLYRRLGFRPVGEHLTLTMATPSGAAGHANV